MGEGTQAPASENNANGGGQQSNQTQAQPTERTFTQADLDRIIAERIGRLESKYSDYADLKKKAEDLEAAQKTEAEKASDRAAKAEAKVKELETKTRQRVITAEAKALAAELQFAKPDKAIRLIDLDKVQIDEDGTVSGLKEQFDALAKEMPELLISKKTAPVTGAPNPARTETQTSGQQSAADWYKNSRNQSALNSWTGKGELVMPPNVGE